MRTLIKIMFVIIFITIGLDWLNTTILRLPIKPFIIIIIIIIIIIYSLVFTSALVDGLPLEIEWQQVSSSLQESSQDSGRSQ